MSRIVIVMNAKSTRDDRMKEMAGWVEKAPQRKCSVCKYLCRLGAYETMYFCELHKFRTKANSVCQGFTRKEKVEE